MMNFDVYISFMLILMSLFMFSWYYKHLLLTIISLEFLMVSIFFNLYLLLFNFNNSFIMMYFLSISVCEGALALSLIVIMVRSYGNDYLNSLMILKW